MDRQFEKRLKEAFGIAPAETRLLLKIADGLIDELKWAVRGTGIENDMDALLVLTRLDRWEQARFVLAVFEGMDPQEGVEMVSRGEFQALVAEEHPKGKRTG